VLLLETARELFAARGVAAVTMADIASDAGVGKGTLYRRFSNKGELCFALLDDDLQRFQNDVLLRLRQMTAERVPFLRQLRFFLDDLVHFTADNQALLCEVARSGAAGGEDVELPHFWQQLTIRGLLQQAVGNQEVAPHLDIPCTAALLVAPLHATVLRTYRGGLGFSLEQISAGIGALVDGLAI
jgi:AcrR family transcriptional regulator